LNFDAARLWFDDWLTDDEWAAGEPVVPTRWKQNGALLEPDGSDSQRFRRAEVSMQASLKHEELRVLSALAAARDKAPRDPRPPLRPPSSATMTTQQLMVQDSRMREHFQQFRHAMGKTGDVTKNNVNYCTQVLTQSVLKTFPAEMVSVKGSGDQRRLSFSEDQTGVQEQAAYATTVEEQNSALRRSLLAHQGVAEFGKLFRSKTDQRRQLEDLPKRAAAVTDPAWEAALEAADIARSVPERSAEPT
jgi:hypothetical protein